MHSAALPIAIFFIATNARAGEWSPERADALLNAFEARMKSVESFQANCTRAETHPLTKRTTVYEGQVAWKKPNLAKIDLTHSDEIGKTDAEKTQFERYICNGTNIYEYSAKERVVVVQALPKNDREGENVVLSLLKGMTASELKKRFEVRVLDADDPRTKEWYAFVRMAPKNAVDKQDFKYIELCIYLKNPNHGAADKPDLMNLPCQIRFEQPNGREVRYRFGDMRPNAKFDADAFAPRLIKGYSLKTAATPIPK